MSSARPHVPTANTCENCDKHLRIIHSDSTIPRCDRCLPDDMTELKTCACHLDVQCQKNHWKAHRAACRTARKNTEVAHVLGSEARHLSFVDWCKRSREQFVFPALWALGAGTETDRTATHIFVIYIDVDEEISTTSKPHFKRRLRTAKCVSEDELKQEFAARYSSEWKVPPSAPLCARIWLVDDGLPYGLEGVDRMTELIGIAKVRSEVFPGMECDWLALLEDSVAAGVPIPPNTHIYRRGSNRTVDHLRFTHTEQWKTSYATHFCLAAYSALNVPQHPNQIGTHCLVVYVNMEEKQLGVFGKITIRSAKMASLDDLQPLFHADVFGRGSSDIALSSQPNLLRTLIIDDSLAHGHNIHVVAMDMSKVSDIRTRYPYYSDWLARLKGIIEK
ncbi:hypothetical protein B0H19DRAFT_1076005 [Mycena capillaripes]|nr:hypothetical protein B0H19DRAFT_1076005 [Mycena capillaripes]